MAAQILKALLQLRSTRFKKRQKNSGFTILELLVATLIATMVLIALLDMVVDLLNTDRREYARNETQREMQMALDYMVNDIREAAYVYNKAELDRVTQYLKLPAGHTPILGFWKPQTIADTDMGSLQDCSRFGPHNPDNPNLRRIECDQLLVRRRAFSLVVYLQKVNEPNNPSEKNWKGISRIARFQMNKYVQNGISNLTPTPGYVDPQADTVKFETWPLKADNQVASGALAGRGEGSPQVLVDFVDFPTRNRTDNLNPPDRPQCPDENLPQNQRVYSRIPDDNSSFNSPSFMVCVSTNNSLGSGADISNVNQDVFLFLRGNPTGKAGVKVAPLLAVKTQAVARGVVNKQPQ